VLGCPTLAPAIRALFPASAVAAELHGGADPGLLLPAERVHVLRAAAKRASHFAAGRLCARLALTQLDVHGFALCSAADRRPLWPNGIVGSITHTDDTCAAVVAPSTDVRGLGIDIETVGGISADIASTVCTPEEYADARSHTGAWRDVLLTLIFSAKEAFFKCQYPDTREWLEFNQVAVAISRQTETSGTLTIRILDRVLAARLHPYGVARGRYLVSAATVTAAVSVET
jgi:4'-phosphopantetheinyl transferase EntD